MPRPKIDLYWRNRVRSLVESPPNGERLTDRAIASQLEQEARELGRDDSPGERSVGRIRKEHEGAPERERREYRAFRWPLSMQQGALAWEAAPAALELMRNAKHASPPPMRLVKWFWRVTLAVPDAPFVVRCRLAQWLAAEEAVDPAGAIMHRAVEVEMMYAPWQSHEAHTSYQDALSEGRAAHPQFRFPDSLTSLSPELDEFMELYSWPPKEVGHARTHQAKGTKVGRRGRRRPRGKREA